MLLGLLHRLARRAFPRGMRKRWWLFRPFDLLARHWPAPGPRSGLLVVRMDGIGDMVLYRGFLEAQAAALGFAPDQVTLLGCRSWGSVGAAAFPGVRLRVIDEHRYERRPIYRFRQNLWLRRQRFAVASNDAFFRKALQADSLLFAARAERTVVARPYDHPKTAREFAWYGAGWTIVDTGPYPTHETIRHAAFIAALTGEKAKSPAPPILPWRDQAPPIPPGRPYVVLNTGANEPGRRWPLEAFLALGARLLDQGYRVAVVGTARDAVHRPALRQALNRPGVIDLMGRTSLAGLCDVLKHAAAVVSGDTGPMHLAIALGTPTIGVVGGGHFGAFVPYPASATPDRVRFPHVEMDCYHCFWRCHKRLSDADSFPCVAAVGVEAVEAALREILAPDTDVKAAAQ